jgi:mannosyltransferase
MKKLIIKYPLLILILLAILLRLPLINGSFWMDEAAQALEVIRPLNQQLDIVADFQPPLLHLILHFAQYFSHSEWFLRTIGALIPGIITLIFTFKLAKTINNKKVAILSTALLTTSSFHIYFSQELRPYSLPTMLAMMSMFYLLSYLKNNKRRNLILLTIINGLGLYASYLFPFFILAQFSYVLATLKFNQTKILLTSFLISILSFLPILPLFLQQLEAGGLVRQQLPGWDIVVSVNQLKAVPFVFAKLIFGVLLLDLNLTIVFLTTLLGMSLVGLIYYTIKNHKKASFKFYLCWLIVPLLLAWIISFIVPVIQPKRLLFLLPGIYIFLATLTAQPLTKFFQNGLQKLSVYEKSAVAFITALFLTNLIGIVSYYTNPILQREDWRSLSIQLRQEFPVQETLLVYSFPDEFAPMRWYGLNQPEQFTTFSTGVLYLEDLPDLANRLKIASNYKTIVVFDYLRDLTDPNNKIIKYLHELGF